MTPASSLDHQPTNFQLVVVELNNYSEALASCNKVIQIDKDVTVPFIKGLALAALCRYEEALESYNEALQRDAKAVYVYVNKGVLLLKVDRDAEALEVFDKALQLDLNDICAYSGKGITLARLGQHADAIKIFAKTLQIDSKDVSSYIIKGIILRIAFNDYTNALKAFDKASQLGLQDASMHLARGITLAELGRYKEALCDFDKVIEINPNSAEIFYYKAILLTEMRRYEDAISAIDEALKRVPNNENFLYTKSIIQQEQKFATSLLTKGSDLHKKQLAGFNIPISPTHYECAILSDQVYEDNGGENLPENWVLLHTSRDNVFNDTFSIQDYFGATYLNEVTKQIVIAHRGTKNKGSWKANFQIAYNKLPEQFSAAKAFSEKIKELFPDYACHITFTGHSLGGALAELCAWEDNYTQAVAFDSPGASEIIELLKGKADLAEKSVRVINYLSEPDIVNTWRPHLGERVRIFPLHPKEKGIIRLAGLFEIFFPILAILYREGKSNINKHQLENILTAFDKETGLPRIRQQIISWPDTSTLTIFNDFCKTRNIHGFDPNPKILMPNDTEYLKNRIHYCLEPFNPDSNNKFIELSRFSKAARAFLISYLKDNYNNYGFDNRLLNSYTIKEIRDRQVVEVTREDMITAEDFRQYVERTIANYNCEFFRRKHKQYADLEEGKNKKVEDTNDESLKKMKI